MTKRGSGWRYQAYQNNLDQYHWQLISPSGEERAISPQGYPTQEEALHACEKVLRHAGQAELHQPSEAEL